MSAMLSSHDIARLRQAALLGLARQPLAVPEPLKPVVAAAAPPRDPVLTVLALAGQQQRFERTTVTRDADAVPEAARRLHADPRPILPERARRALLRVASGADKGLADAVVGAGARRVIHAGWRLHPFDLARLIDHIRGDVRCLGLAERAYRVLAAGADAATAPSLLHDEITPDNWTFFPRGHRVAFLRDQRRKNPAAARALLEGVFMAEPAPSRAALLEGLDVGLGLDDLPFLEEVAKDRADSVRAVAAGLLARVPGTTAYDTRLAEAARCFARSGGGVAGILSRIGLGTSIAFRPPRSGARNEQEVAIARLFAGFSVAEIASASGLTAAEVIGALPVDEAAIHAAFGERAAHDGDDAVMAQLAAARLEAAEAKTRSPAPILAWLADHLAAPVAVEFGDTLLGSAAFRAALQRFGDTTTPSAMKDDGTLVFTAAVLPAALVPAFLATITPLHTVTARTSRDFADLVLALEAAPTS